MIDLAYVQNVLNQIYAPLISDQLNQRSILLSKVSKTIGSGKNIAWDVKLARGASAGSFGSGADIAGDDQDTEVPAVLQWKRLKAEFRVAGDALAAAATAGPQAYVNLLGKQIADATRNLGILLNQQVYGDGTGNGGLDLDGLSAIVANTGTYAGINRATAANAAWRGLVKANGGVPRALDLDLMRAAEADVFKASGYSPDFIITNPDVYQKYEAMFDNSTRRLVDQPFELGAQSLSFKGIPIFRDPHCPAGKMFFLTKDSIDFEMLPIPTVQNGINLVAGESPVMTADGNLGIQVGIEMLGRSGDSYKGYVKVYGNLVGRFPVRNCVIEDIEA